MKMPLLAVAILAVISLARASVQQQTSLPTGSYRQTPEAAHPRLPEARVSPPKVLHWCAQHCSTWVWMGNRYVGKGTVHPELSPQCGVTVERFDSEAVVMHRTDCGQFPGKATLTGKLSANGESIVNGVIEWTYHPCCGLAKGQFRAAWGSSIDSVPGADPPRPQGPTASVMNPGAALLMSILGLQADGTRASVDLTEKITQLEETVADARDACSHDLRQEAYEQCQHNVAEQEDKLYWAYDDLQTEIEKLEEAQTQLTSECKTGKKESCSKLNQVNARLKKDTNFLNLPSFLHGVK